MDAADPDLPDAAVEHISQMLTLAKRILLLQSRSEI